MVRENTVYNNNEGAVGSVAEYLRRYSRALEDFSDFEKFCGSLAAALEEDKYFFNSLLAAEEHSSEDELRKAEKAFKMGTVTLPLQGDAASRFIRVAGRRDERPFNAEDLHLMGAIAGFVSVLTAKAQQFRAKDESSRVFQFLINQLPLGVVCFDAQGGLLIENQLASQLLGDSGADLMRGIFLDTAFPQNGKAQMHLEMDGRLLYAEGRHLNVDDTLSVHAFVLHDMSVQREKNLLQLERSLFRAESRQTPLSVAVIEDRSEAGRLYRMLKESAASLQLDSQQILMLDAYTCACVFTGQCLRTARHLLRNGMPTALDRDAVIGAFIAASAVIGDEIAAQSLIDAARDVMRPLAELLRPALLVLDPYPAVLESLTWIGDEMASFERVDEVEWALKRVESGEFDGLFLDIEAFGDQALERIQVVSRQLGDSFGIFYVSHRQPSMVGSSYALGADATIFQKPFDANKLRQVLAARLDLS